ncbi:MAG: hypothetical protein P4M14_05540 [Gammaproteobacteria bacterium]|nr:hypothetical protein [Gammaproteobacteria bacterium]
MSTYNNDSQKKASPDQTRGNPQNPGARPAGADQKPGVKNPQQTPSKPAGKNPASTGGKF